jgi:hypothetical protein
MLPHFYHFSHFQNITRFQIISMQVSKESSSGSSNTFAKALVIVSAGTQRQALGRT